MLALAGRRRPARGPPPDRRAATRGAALALDVYCYRIRKYVGAYLAALGRADAIVFTARRRRERRDRARALAGRARALGIAVDPERNASASREPRVISPDGSPVAVLVIPTDEELEMALQAAALVGVFEPLRQADGNGFAG